MNLPPSVMAQLALVGILLAATACVSPPDPGLAASSRPRDLKPMVSERDLRTVVEGNNAFALDLYQILRAADGNLVYSPFSISMAFAMTHAGARGQTETEMARVLHFGLPRERLHPGLNSLDLTMTQAAAAGAGEGQPLQLNIANATWAQRGYDFQPDYLDLLAANYGAGVRLADFQASPEPARLDINRWVSGQTQNRISNLLPPESIGADTRMVLVNAVYFKAGWMDPFEKSSTHRAAFHLLDGTDVDVDMMSATVEVPYISGPGYQAVELPYAGGTAAMDIFVPDADRFYEFELSLGSDGLAEMLQDLRSTLVQLTLPRYQFSSELSLAKDLGSLGMLAAFDPAQADFSGMTGNRDLYISDAVHKAFVAVDEAGTEAAAATGVVVGVTGAPISGQVLTIDRPFIFLVRDLQTGQILFFGRVLNPAQS